MSIRLRLTLLYSPGCRNRGDLDQATRDELTRGERLVEILKQTQFEPMPVEQQTMIIWVGTAGLLDDVPLPSVKRFEKEFHGYMKAKHPAIGETIRQSKVLDDTTVDRLKTATLEFKKQFKA